MGLQVAAKGLVERGVPLPSALEEAAVPDPAAEFVRLTWVFVERGSLPEIAAAFTFGREELIPDMFRGIMADLRANHGSRLSRFAL